jgi:hypothetical protein
MGRGKRVVGALLAVFGIAAVLSAPMAVIHVASAAADGILPPGQPSANIDPSSNDYLVATNTARAQEGVGPLLINRAALDAMPIPAQLFVITNLERVARGEPPFVAMTAQLDSYSQVGADNGTDPPLPTVFAGGGTNQQGGGNWIGATSNPFEANYVWMYRDGWGGNGLTDNITCTGSGAAGCWGHRTNELFQFTTCGLLGLFAGAPKLVMGAAYNPTGYLGGPSIATIYGSTCGAMPPDIVFTWQQALAMVSAPIISMAATPNGGGYWLVGSDGSVQAFGNASNFGSMAGQPLNQPVVGMAPTTDGRGYWLVAADGGIFSFGDAQFFGSTGNLHLNRPIVGMTAYPWGGGYWFVASDGGVFSYGNAPFLGSMGGTQLNRPVVGMAADPSTGGYWLVAADGGIFSFGTNFYGSTGDMHLNQPIGGMEAAPDGSGYRFVASDGGVFAFNIPFEGSEGGGQLSMPVVGMAAVGDNGYWLATADGRVYAFGSAKFYGNSA